MCADIEEKVVMTTCNSHCGGTCVLKVHVRDGVITRIETDDGEEPQFRACARGRAYRQRVYAPDRLQFPMRRTGERGEGKFERVSWDEALATVAGETRRVRDTYGAEAILLLASSGDITWLHGRKALDRLLNLAGGYSRTWGSISYEAGVFAELATYGSLLASNTRDDLVNSRLIVLWALDPANTVHDTNTAWYLAQAREAGARIISVDPRYTDSTAVFADQWIPVAPGTDAAMLIAMACVMIQENLHDQEFLDAYTVGFEQFRDYVLGVEDGVPKTPAWAEAITGVPAATIAGLAREYATTKPAALLAGIAPGRTAYGEQYHRAAMTLTAMTGNIGIPGGEAAGRSWTAGYGGHPLLKLGRGMRGGRNPVEETERHAPDELPMRKGPVGWARLNRHRAADAILRGKAGGYPADYKLLYLVNRNLVNQAANTKKVVRALKSLEFVVVQEQFMTATARFADILLPGNTLLERNDVTCGGATPYYGCMNKAIDSLYESKSHLEITVELARHMGISEFNDHTEEEWVEEIVRPSGIAFEAFRKTGAYKIPMPEPYVAFREEIADPEHHRFPTPSGKIEIYSQRLADLGDPKLPPIPKYLETWESRNDPLAQKYPLQLITTHFKRRAHTQFENVPWLRELQTQAIGISPADAGPRGIRDGDMVRVFNDRGEMIIPARVTERITPGVVDIPQGAWYDPDERGVDRGGCANVLTRDEPSPGGGFVSNTTLVQVEKA